MQENKPIQNILFCPRQDHINEYNEEQDEEEEEQEDNPDEENQDDEENPDEESIEQQRQRRQHLDVEEKRMRLQQQHEENEIIEENNEEKYNMHHRHLKQILVENNNNNEAKIKIPISDIYEIYEERHLYRSQCCGHACAVDNRLLHFIARSFVVIIILFFSIYSATLSHGVEREAYIIIITSILSTYIQSNMINKLHNAKDFLSSSRRES